MRMRIGLVVGFGLGYYLGARAGRERYERINELLRQAKESDAAATATEKARAVVDLGKERARDLTRLKSGNGSASPPPAQESSSPSPGDRETKGDETGGN